jgi:hypothetical protein
VAPGHATRKLAGATTMNRSPCGYSPIPFIVGFVSIACHQSFVRASDAPHLRLQRWATATHINWVRRIALDRVAVSYSSGAGPRNGFGLDVLDSSGTVVRRVWPLPTDYYCAAVYPDGRCSFARRGFGV